MSAASEGSGLSTVCANEQILKTYPDQETCAAPCRYERSLSANHAITLEKRVIAKADNVRVNDEIRAREVRVVQPDGEHGVHPLDDALDIAYDHQLDLVEVAPNADPPVCKVIDYGKYKYKQQKKEKERRKKAQTTQLKELRFRPRTDDHDFNFKTEHARDFLENGNKVRAYVQFRGRDIIYKDQGMEMLKKFIEELQDLARIDQPPQMEGRRMTTILAPHKK